MYEAGKVDGTAIIAGGEAPEMLHAAKASFDPVAMLVDGFVLGDEDLTVALGKDRRFNLHSCNQVTQAIAVMGIVGEYRLGLLSF